MPRWAAWTAIVLLLPCEARAIDSIEYIDGEGNRKTARGNLREDNAREVVIQTASGEARIPAHQIELIRFDKQPPEIVNARSKARQGRFEEAIADFQEIEKNLGENKTDQLHAEILFEIFRCSAELAIADASRADEALKAHQRLTSSYSNTWRHYPTHELVGRVYLAMGDYDRAAKAFSVLKEVDWPGYKEKALLYEGLALLARGKAAEAIAAFDQVLANQADDRVVNEQRLAAKVYKGDALVRSGKPADAEKLLREALEEVTAPSEIGAVGHNALGDALLAQNKPPKQAVLDGYMWVNVIHNKNPEQLARALYHLSQLMPKIGKPDDGDQLAARLRSEFPNSSWAKKLGEQKPTTP